MSNSGAPLRVKGLKDELKARGESRGGTKHVLQRRLHGLLVQAAIVRQKRHRKRPRPSRRQMHAEIFGSDDSDCPSRSPSSDESDSGESEGSSYSSPSQSDDNSGDCSS